MSTPEDFLNNKAWCFKMVEIVFKKSDIDQDGYLSKEDRMHSQSRFIDYAQKLSVDQKILDAHKAATEKSLSAFGTESDRVSKEDFLKKLAEVAAVDQERIKRGEEPLLAKSSESMFDIMDGDKDGFVTLEDFKPAYVAIGWDAESAEQAFKYIDKIDSAKIGREEWIKSTRDFWYKLDFERTGSSTEDFLNSKAWCHKMEEIVFKKADVDQDGYISKEDRMHSQSRFIDYAQKHSIDKEVLEGHKATSEKYLSAFGTESDRVSKEDFLKKLAEFAAADQERLKQGEEPILAGTSGPFFDLMDSNKDGFATVEDFKPLYVAIGWDAESAEKIFKMLDKNNSGKIGREEWIKSSHDFWYKV